MSEQRDGLIFALDVETLEDARSWAERLEGSVGWIKVGSRLFCAEGPPVVEVLRKYGFKVFLTPGRQPGNSFVVLYPGFFDAL